jgi:5-hydroxyisourate hydrolase
VLDGTYGKSAVGVQASLEYASEDNWSVIADGETDSDGRIQEWDPGYLKRGLYKIVLDSDGYFARLGSATAYPEVIIAFRMEDETQQVQIQVTLSPYAYSAFFGTLEAAEGGYQG